jgi:hypothetical protein
MEADEEGKGRIKVRRDPQRDTHSRRGLSPATLWAWLSSASLGDRGRHRRAGTALMMVSHIDLIYLRRVIIGDRRQYQP